MFHWIGKSDDGKKVTLKKFEGDFSSLKEAPEEEVRKAVILDVETTGMDSRKDQIIEIAIQEFSFDRRNGNLVRIGRLFEALQDPGQPLTEEIIRLTGLRDADLQGQQIDWEAADAILKDADLIIAHNARFDRPFVERKSSVSSKKIWGCSLKQVDWWSRGFTSSKLEVLSIYHGFFVDAHRARSDVHALLKLLSYGDPGSDRTYLNDILVNARKPMVKILATHSPFETKDDLRNRGYRWDSKDRVWHRTLEKSRFEEEKIWLEALVYKGDYQGQSIDIAPQDQFKG